MGEFQKQILKKYRRAKVEGRSPMEGAILDIVSDAEKEFPNPLDEKYKTYYYDFKENKMKPKGINAGYLHYDCWNWFEKWFGANGKEST